MKYCMTIHKLFMGLHDLRVFILLSPPFFVPTPILGNAELEEKMEALKH